MQRRHSHVSLVIAIVVAGLATAGPAPAEQVKCQRAIAKESSKFLQARAKALQKCQDGIVKGGSGPCPDDKADAAIQKAVSKLTAGIGKACGGDDKLCGKDLTNEDNRVALGWPAQCPDLARASCDSVINDCSGIGECLACMDGSAVDQGLRLAYDNLQLPSATSALNKCQRAIGKATAKFLAAKSKTLQKCWDARLKGKHTNSCVPPAVCHGGSNDGTSCTTASECPDGTCGAGDGKYVAAIQKAETKKVATICKACGGADKGCDDDVDTGLIVSGGTTITGTGGSDDLTPSAIGFAPTCPAMTLPYDPNTSCDTLDDIDGTANAIDSLRELVLCLDCVSEAATDCADANQMAGLASYPAVCNSCAAGPPTSGPCPTRLEFTADGPSVDLDSGWTGLAHDFFYPSDLRTTLDVSCPGPSRPTCGVCDIDGPIPNDGGPTYDTRRCTIRTWIKCNSDVDCLGTCSGGTNAGEPCNELSDCPDQSLGTSCHDGGTCEYFLSPPLSLSAGGTPACIVNQLVGPVSGTINVETGEMRMPMFILSRVYPIGTVLQPCPLCENGQCDSGPRVGQPCVVNGSNVYGDASLDCPPTQGSQAGTQTEDLQNLTGPQTWALNAESPNCRTPYKICLDGANAGQLCSNDSECPGGSGICQVPKCFCDTCNNADADPCASNADCPDNPPGTPGICGGKRCLSGTNAGAPCTAPSECPGGLCGYPGEKTNPNSCWPPDGGLDGCQPTTGNEGECVDGPVDQYCSVQVSRACLVDSDCDPSDNCPDCLPGQACLTKPRKCFPDNGVLGGSVSVSGHADAPCAGTYSTPSFSSLFCLSPSGSGAFNAAAGEPGLVSQVLPGKLRLTP